MVADLEVLPDGRVWVLNSVEPFFIGFAPDGVIIGEHGRQGGGPDEIRRPAGFVVGGLDGEAWVVDPVRPSLIRVSRPEDPWTEVRIPPDSLPPQTFIGGRDMTVNTMRTARLGGEVIIPRTILAGEGGMLSLWRSIWGADLLAVDPVVGTARGVLRLSEVLDDPMPHIPATSDFPPFPLWWRLWAVCSETEIRVHDRLRNQIRGFDAKGSELASITLPKPRLTDVSRMQFARSLLDVAAVQAAQQVGLEPPQVDTARLLPLVLPRVEGTGTELASLLPRYVDMHCTTQGVLWIRAFDIDGGGLRGGLTWLRIDPSGMVREVRLPERFDPFRFTQSRIWGVQRDELNVASVAWLEWEETAMAGR